MTTKELENLLEDQVNVLGIDFACSLEKASDQRVMFTEYFQNEFRSHMMGILQTQRDLILAELRQEKKK